MANTLLIAVTLVIAALRFTITPRLDLPTAEGSYEAFAHLFVGGLFGAFAMHFHSVRAVREDPYGDLETSDTAWLCLALGVLVSLLELVMFLIQKYS